MSKGSDVIIIIDVARLPSQL